jgi:phage gp45-like
VSALREFAARHVAPLQARVRALVRRGAVRLVTEASGVRLLQVTARNGDAPDDVRHVEPLGLVARPLVGARALILRLLGAADAQLVVTVWDPRHRPTDAAEGETGLYDCAVAPATQDRIRLRPGVGVQVIAPVTDIGPAVPCAATDGVVTGLGFDPFTGQTQFALGNASAVVRAKKA